MLDRYIADNAHRVRAPLERVQSKPAQGHHHDLDAIYRELNGGYFEEAITASIHWGRKPTRRRRRSIQLGTYVATDDLIRIHPALDQDWVPTFFVAFIVFHEMLHAAVGGPVTNGRQYFHNARFRALERSYPDYDRAIAWERKHLDRLLRWT